MALSAAQMSELLAGGKAANNGFVNGQWTVTKLTATTVGAYTGRAGTVTRNRKGRTSRKPDGWRQYWNVEENVQAYHASKVVK